MKRVVDALRKAAEKEDEYASHRDGQAETLSAATHISIGNALERVAHLLEEEECVRRLNEHPPIGGRYYTRDNSPCGRCKVLREEVDRLADRRDELAEALRPFAEAARRAHGWVNVTPEQWTAALLALDEADHA